MKIGRIIKLNLLILMSYFFIWLILDLISIYGSDPLRVFARLGFNVLLTMPILSGVLIYRHSLGNGEFPVSRKAIVVILNSLIMLLVGMFLLMVCGSFVHFLLGGRV